jgi:hypothetical protein
LFWKQSVRVCNIFICPDPAALKVKGLNFAGNNVTQQVSKACFGGVEVGRFANSGDLCV